MARFVADVRLRVEGQYSIRGNHNESSHFDVTAGSAILVTNTSASNVPGSLLWAVSRTDGGSVIQLDPNLPVTPTGYGPAAGISYGSSARVRLFNSTVAFNSPAPGIGMVPRQEARRT